MRKENSYGIVPLRRHHRDWQILLIQHHAGHWALPKGHAELGETPQQAAERELKEETGLRIQHFLSFDPLSENYVFTFRGEKIFKTVQYFLALVEGNIVIQQREIKSSQWLNLLDAIEQMSFPESKRICQQAIDFLKGRGL